MPVEHASRTLSFDNLCVEVSIYRYICDRCGNREAFPDVPMAEGYTERSAGEKGWRFTNQFHDGEADCLCPKCSGNAA